MDTTETIGGSLGSGAVSAWLWAILRVYVPSLPEMPAAVSPAVGAGLWQLVLMAF